MRDRLTVWPAGNELQRRLAALHRRMAGDLPDALDAQEVREVGLTKPGVLRLSTLSASQCDPHVDPTLPPWSILAVLRAAPGHTIGIADRALPDGGDIGDLDAVAQALRPVRTGDLIRLDIHHVHWLTPARDGGVFTGLSLDFEDRPTRDDAAKAVDRTLRAHGF